MTEYTDYVYNDELTGLVYINWDEYLDHKEEFADVGKELLATWFTNGSIINEITIIRDKLCKVYSWTRWILSCYNSNRVTHDELISAIATIESDIVDLGVEYNHSKNKDSIWKYLGIGMNELFNDIRDNNNFDLSLEKICSYEYLNYLKSLIKENKNND